MTLELYYAIMKKPPKNKPPNYLRRDIAVPDSLDWLLIDVKANKVIPDWVDADIKSQTYTHYLIYQGWPHTAFDEDGRPRPLIRTEKYSQIMLVHKSEYCQRVDEFSNENIKDESFGEGFDFIPDDEDYSEDEEGEAGSFQ
jgi:hypothetical protein